MLRETILGLVVRQFLRLLTPDLLKRVIDDALDSVEQAVADSDNTFDDLTVLPLIATIRTALDIADDVVDEA